MVLNGLFEYSDITFNFYAFLIILPSHSCHTSLIWVIKKDERELANDAGKEIGGDTGRIGHRQLPKLSWLSRHQRNCRTVTTKQIRLQPRYQTASAISSRHEQTLLEPTNHRQTALVHLGVCVCAWTQSGQNNCKSQIDTPIMSGTRDQDVFDRFSFNMFDVSFV